MALLLINCCAEKKKKEKGRREKRRKGRNFEKREWVKFFITILLVNKWRKSIKLLNFFCVNP
jgi:hypothetical protein